ncbi:VOC family protein [Speluncibacter jeojiensis]|uniref:VOC family protein n=1 Tax=Speluncibacter jeojiensis TaxID=2710754 RepID=A0A9X4M2H3_9ACTN|nr:VOC family protein [Corynebacteriales bacterium D3-21]
MTTEARTSEPTLGLVSVRLITDDVARLVEFYGHVLDVPGSWLTPDFAELRTSAGTLAIGSTRTVELFAPGSARPADNHTAIVEFLVSDVDAEYERIAQHAEGSDRAHPIDFVTTPTTMPWGNRSLLLRDPDGTLVNLFTPVAPEARETYGH